MNGTAQVGANAGTCPKCRDQGLVMRVGRKANGEIPVTCRCFDCSITFKGVVKVKKAKKAKGKRKGQVVRTYAGLRGQRASKREWTFKYPTNEYGPLWLKTTKNTWGNWSVWWAAERVASGDTIKEALENAKKRLDDRGYHLSDI